MKAAVLHRPGDIRLEARPKPVLPPGHAILKVEAVGVCGSDYPRMLTKGAHEMPLVCGHEFSGTIVELDESIEGFALGDLVAVPPMLPCLECDQCRTGEFSRCRDYDYFGSRRDGAYAEFVSVPELNLVKVPVGVDPRAAALTDPAAIALHAIWNAGGIRIGQRGGVVGCGPIGLFAIQWLTIMGASEIVAVDVSPHQLTLAKEAGATRTCLGEPSGDALGTCDVVVEAAGTGSSVGSAVRLAGPGGSASFIGIPVRDLKIDSVAFQHFLRQEVSLTGAWNSFSAPYPGREWTATLDMFASGRLRWEFLVSDELPLDDLPGIFQRIQNDGTEAFSKIMFRP